MSGVLINWQQYNKTPPPDIRHADIEENLIREKKRYEKELCDCLIEIFAAIFGVSAHDLRQPARSAGQVNRVRQIAMYVAHVVCRLSMSAIGQGFMRDRTTVLHACHLVEDMRDDVDFDRVVAMAERVVMAAIRNRVDM